MLVEKQLGGHAPVSSYLTAAVSVALSPLPPVRCGMGAGCLSASQAFDKAGLSQPVLTAQAPEAGSGLCVMHSTRMPL